MLVEVYLDPGQALSTLKSAKSVNFETFVVVHSCWLSMFHSQILINKQGRVTIPTSVCFVSSSEKHLRERSSWYKANAFFFFNILILHWADLSQELISILCNLYQYVFGYLEVEKKKINLDTFCYFFIIAPYAVLANFRPFFVSSTNLGNF